VETISTKICNRCKVEKPLERFSLQRRGLLGRMAVCKDCKNVEISVWRKKKAGIAIVVNLSAVKKCSQCKGEFGSDKFGPSKLDSTGLRSRCLKCEKNNSKERRDRDPGSQRKAGKKWRETHLEYVKAANKEWVAKNPEAVRGYILKRRYGIGIVEFDRMLAEQGGCGICVGSDSGVSGRKMSVDHDHKTGKVRGILCRGCNSGIGFLKEDIAVIESAAAYVDRWGSETFDAIGRSKGSIKIKHCRPSVFKSVQGISDTDVDLLVARQAFKCPICLRPLDKDASPALDHDHVSGFIRGVLCGECNKGIGHLKDSSSIMRKAITYLQKHRSGGA
jgi:hypothetical protein